MKEHAVSIWFLIGFQLAIYGGLIAGAGVFDCFNPPPHPTVLANLHAGIWWGAIMEITGLVYIVKYRSVPRCLKATAIPTTGAAES